MSNLIKKSWTDSIVHIFFLNLRWLFDKYAVARTEHDAFVKSTMKIFSNFVAFSENPNFITWYNIDRVKSTLTCGKQGETNQNAPS